MLHEHAITYKDRLSVVDLEYLAIKANKLGQSGRGIISVNEEKDLNGTHIYFDVIGRYDGERGCMEKIQQRSKLFT